MPDPYQINAAETIGGCLAAIYLLSWQVRIGPRDRQSWAALVLILALAVTLAQVFVAYIGVAPFGMSWRSNLSYAAITLSLVWLAWETRAINREIMRRRKLRHIRESLS